MKPQQMLNKVPEVTIFFWIIKILATTVGETAADFLIFNLHFGLSKTSYIIGALLAVVLLVQLNYKKYVPWAYWLAVVFISIFGTLVTDNLTDNFEVPLTTSTAFFSIGLIIIFAVWYNFEKTLSITSIDTTKRELFYWSAILITFALGTAAGDLVAEKYALGYGVSALIFGGFIAASAAWYYFSKANLVTVFWAAYVLTRPFGASCGDLLAQAKEDGGLALGTTNTSFLFIAIITLLVAYLSFKKKQA
jgi:uncharacterized membrane-anchored protein